MVDEKQCMGPCGEVKPLSEFTKRSLSPDGLQYRCRTCSRARCKQYTAENRESIAIRLRMVRFGVSQEQYETMLEAQGGGCAVCETTDPGKGRRNFAVDHDHACCPSHKKACGKCIRGLLCFQCNTLLGNVKDDPAMLEKAADYLRQAAPATRQNRISAEVVQLFGDRSRPDTATTRRTA